MHADEVKTDVALVRRLIAAQFPAWEQLAIDPVESAGTDNALYRLGAEMAVRLPRVHWAVAAGVLTDVPYGMPRAFVLTELSLAGLPIPHRSVLTSVTVGRRKPHPAGLITLAQTLGVSCDRMAYVGNERKDFTGANAAGCASVLLWRSTEEAPAWGQSFTIRSLDRLFELPLSTR